MRYAKTDEARKADAITRLADLPPPVPDINLPPCLANPVPLDDILLDDDMLIRLFGTDRLDDLELLGKVTIDATGNVRLGFGPYRGELLTAVDVVDECSEVNHSFNQGSAEFKSLPSEGLPSNPEVNMVHLREPGVVQVLYLSRPPSARLGASVN
jgi:hypothetical protein